MRFAAPAALALAALLVAPALGTASHDPDAAALRALDFLRTIQAQDGSVGGEASSAWAAIAFASAGVDPATVRAPGGASLAEFVAASTRPVGPSVPLTSLERQVLGLAAAGLDPRVAPGFDAVQAILAEFDGAQLGAQDLLNDDVFGLQALVAAGVPASDPVVQAVRAHVLQNQQPTGAWSYAAFAAVPPTATTLGGVVLQDVDTTSQAIVALLATGSAPGDVEILRGMAFLRANQNLDGGCTWGPASLLFSAVFAPETLFVSNSASTSWTIMGLGAMGQDPEGLLWTSASGETPVSFLLGLQQPDGSFPFQPGEPGLGGPASFTAWAAIALLGHSFVA